MSAILYQQGNLFPCESRFLFHPVGINGKFYETVSNEYPYAKEAYDEMMEEKDVYPGMMQMVKCRDIVVINAFVYIGGRLSFDALISCLEEIDYTIYGNTIAFCKDFFPARDWPIIEGMIESRIETLNPIVYY